MSRKLSSDKNGLAVQVFCSFSEMRDPAGLVPNPRNPNTHSPAQVELLARVIKAHGWRAPITVSKRSGFVVRGHGRLMAALKLGCKTVPVDMQDYESEALEYADLIADNRLAELSEIDPVALKDLIKDIDLAGYDVGLTGYTVSDLDDLEPAREVKEDDFDAEAAAEAVVVPVTKPGDMIILGRHRLLCGDSTSSDDVLRLMDGRKADLVFTSPPYNVGIKYSDHDDEMTTDDYMAMMRAIIKNCYDNMNDGRIVAWNVGVSPKSRPHIHAVMLEDAGFQLFRHIVWKKTGAQIPLWQNSKKKPVARYYLPNYNHELIYLFSKGEVQTGAPTDMPDELSMDVCEVTQFSAGGHDHPAAFPVKLASLYITVLSADNESVYEPFCGSGTTMIACEQLGRTCYGMEISPKYCDVIIQRWEKLTGKKAIRNG